MTLGELFSLRADERRDAAFFVTDGSSTSYADTFALARRVAGLLVQHVGCGETAALLLPSGPAFAAAFFGAQLAGVRALALDPRLVDPEVEFLLRHAEARLLVTDRALTDPPPNCRVVSLVEAFASHPVLGGERTVRDSDVAVLLATSGSTASPKIVALTHSSLLANVSMWSARYPLSPEDVVVSPLSLLHSFGLTTCLFATLDAGATLVPAGSFPAEILRALREERGTVLAAVATTYGWIARTSGVSRATAPSLRRALSGACALPVSVIDRIEAGFECPLLQTYGLTEAAPVVTGNPIGRNRAGTVGPALDGVTLDVVDDELIVSGPSVMRGYFRNDRATEAAFDDRGRLRTGDCARIDDDGWVTILGRKKDLIVRAGAKIFPEEVEEALALHGDVLEAAVVGQPDPALEEVPVAFVVARAGHSIDPSDLIAHCRERLAAYKVPKTVRVVPELPRNPNGKVLKRHLRGELAS